MGGEGVKELYELSEKYHGHKYKKGAEWWLRDEIEPAAQPRGYAADKFFQEKAALMWRELAARIKAPLEVRISAFRKALLASMTSQIYRATSEDENRMMWILQRLFKETGFLESLDFRDEYSEF